MRQAIGLLYDQLVRFESIFIRAFKGNHPYPIHKKLKFNGLGKSVHYTDINDWILDNIHIGDNARVLDAGCGVGKTLFEISRKRNITGVGISLSEAEVQIARRAFETLHNRNCTFKVKSFNDVFSDKFDLIIAIESLKHSANLPYSLENLVASLHAGGLLIIAEDFQNGHIDDDDMKRTFMDSWSLADLYDENIYMNLLSQKDGEIKSVVDFTRYVNKKNGRWLQYCIKLLSVMRSILPFHLLKNICLIFMGGIILDYYYASGLMEYKLICFQKRGSRKDNSPTHPA